MGLLVLKMGGDTIVQDAAANAALQHHLHKNMATRPNVELGFRPIGAYNPSPISIKAMTLIALDERLIRISINKRISSI